MSRITPEQETWINSLVCERLSSNRENESLLNFECTYNTYLGDHILSDEAIKNEDNKYYAYYVIKDRSNEVILYFSLRCGLLYEDNIINNNQLHDVCEIYTKLHNEDHVTPEEKQILEDFIAANSLSDKEMKDYVNKNRAVKLKQRADSKIDGCGNVRLVDRTISAIEIAHFCKNDKYINKFQIPRKLGETIFWLKIVPIIENILHHIGSEYVYLFAADCDENYSLSNYYNQRLKFCKQPYYGVNKPADNLVCKFMYQSIHEILKNQKSFKDNFNLP